ncbi:XRE family transcriptional regulator [Roseofilum casamattae]|uniref:XRE family transcriptional regulator n=1 Tax=Roseofilum casamattae BLCC-M143 TaxID=3022442 RepID=A0ABT7BUM9_9CYAN|nr:XRE family transcriptional regulator [Roseofilum casamattae]MDJ1181973.1 XRE family transcriptional regulator [Roseofilum casamattae BLCC-M143]
MNQPIQIQTGSGNVFADLELEKSEELLLKAELTRKITRTIADRDMTEIEVEKFLEIDRSKVLAFVNGKLSISSTFSTTELFRFLNILGR